MNRAQVPEILAGFNGLRWRWGVLDCCMFAAAVLEQLHGRDFAAGWRGKYRTHARAQRLIEERGGLEAILTEIFGPPVPPLTVRRGDPVLARDPDRFHDGEAVGIADGRLAVFITSDGLMTMPLSRCAMGWRVDG
ncbi:MAG TPA: hypothetical protein PLS34_12495 [Gammaproteobacteria bacterium]|nr:hypothetical protein [Gammaproteobacteria bacterium]